MNNKLLENIKCPITQQIFRNPITLKNGITYEYEAIQDNSVSINVNLKNIIDKLEFAKAFESHLRFKEYNYFFLKQNIFCVEKFISLKNNELKNYLDNVNLETYNCDNSYHYDNYDCIKPIHYICKNSTPEIIKYIIDKGVNLEVKTKYYGDNPIHLICKYSTPEMIRYIIDKDVDLEATNYYGEKPIHLICQYSTPEIIKYIINKNVDLEAKTFLNETPIYFINKRNDYLIKFNNYIFLFEFGINVLCILLLYC